MPELSRFFGIVIAMYHNDHPPPHFHARYGAEKGRFRIDTLEMIEGNLGPRVRGLVVEWASAHQAELAANWERCRAQQPTVRIAPLQ